MKLMNCIISLLVIVSLLFSQIAYADCDFKTGIASGPNKTFIYSEACHQKVGALVQDNQVKTEQVAELNKAVTLKDLALKDSDKRATDWMNTSGTLEKRVQEVDKLESTNKFLYFGLGVLTTFLAAYGAAKLVNK
jgi:hypothetical protein